MISLEGLIRELFFRANAWRRILIVGALCYVLLGFGYLRALAKTSSESAQPGLPPVRFDKKLWKLTFSALPLGAFYFLVPLVFAYGADNLLLLASGNDTGLRAVLALSLSPIVWSAAWICSLSLTAVALATVPDDGERFFLGLEFEEVLAQWWKLKRAWAFPALGCFGLVAALGQPFYGFTFFISSALLVTYLSLTVRNLRYA
jgi:hypothetical protein